MRSRTRNGRTSWRHQPFIDGFHTVVGRAGLRVDDRDVQAGSEPPPWNDNSKEGAPTRPKSFDSLKRFNIASLNDLPDPHLLAGKSAKTIDFVDPMDGLIGGGGESRMNRATFDFITNKDNELYNVEGQERLYTAIIDGKREALSFPVDSMEIKAMWKPLTDDDIKSGKSSRYHVSKDTEGKTYGLISLHVITKDVPNWFWSSFRHVDGPLAEIPSVDTNGRPDKLKGTKWEYYELSGTQTDFTDSMGRVSLLSDPLIEQGFQRSSCISCHALSSIGAPSTIKRGDRLKFVTIAPTNPLTPLAPIGPPDPLLFFDTNPSAKVRQKYVQLDFVFSMHFRAWRKKTP